MKLKSVLIAVALLAVTLIAAKLVVFTWYQSTHRLSAQDERSR